MRVPVVVLIAALAFGATAPAQIRIPTSESPESQLALMQKAQVHFAKDEFAKLEELAIGYHKSEARSADGEQELYLLTTALARSFGLKGNGEDQRVARKLATWHEQFPQSALQPIAAAMQAHRTAWRARGNGLDADVTVEGQQLFRERNLLALKILMDNKKQSSTLPAWYEYAVLASSDFGMPGAASRELFDEGIRRFPGYVGIYFAQVRQLSPLWGGNWQAVDAFIVEQAAAKPGKTGESLYARLYAYVDEVSGRSPDFFEESMASWPRLRGSFEALLVEFPEGKRNHARFAAFACRAHDEKTYTKLRLGLDLTEFYFVAPQGMSSEICDARFMKST